MKHELFRNGDYFISVEVLGDSVSTIEENLHDNSGDDGAEAFNNMLDGLTCLILHCHNNGVEVTTPEFKRSIADAMETIANYC